MPRSRISTAGSRPLSGSSSITSRGHRAGSDAAGATSAWVGVRRRAGLPIRGRASGPRCSPRPRRTQFWVRRGLFSSAHRRPRAHLLWEGGDRHDAAEWTACVECEERATRAGHPRFEWRFGHRGIEAERVPPRRKEEASGGVAVPAPRTVQVRWPSVALHPERYPGREAPQTIKCPRPERLRS